VKINTLFCDLDGDEEDPIYNQDVRTQSQDPTDPMCHGQQTSSDLLALIIS
jgi:hypothetical protein